MGNSAKGRGVELSPERLLVAYANGFFPMADEHGRVGWYTADPRAILHLPDFRVPRTLRSILRRKAFELRVNTEFEAVIRQCAHRREGSWINDEIVAAYCELRRLGHAHSVEAFLDGDLVGGLYGVSLGGAFFGESMFHTVSDASKVALCRLIEILQQRGFVLLDIQMMTEHLRRFGASEIPADDYTSRLHAAIRLPRTFTD